MAVRSRCVGQNCRREGNELLTVPSSYVGQNCWQEGNELPTVQSGRVGENCWRNSEGNEFLTVRSSCVVPNCWRKSNEFLTVLSGCVGQNRQRKANVALEKQDSLVRQLDNRCTGRCTPAELEGYMTGILGNQRVSSIIWRNRGRSTTLFRIVAFWRDLG